VHYLRELVHRLRAGASQRAIARDLGVARETVHNYAQLAAEAGYLDAAQPLPDAAELTARLGPPPHPPRTPSSLEPHRQLVETLLAEGVEMMTIFDRLTERGYAGSYSSVRRFVRTLRPAKSLVVVRVHTAAGEEAQVDFGSAGTLLDPIGDRPRRAWVFVMTLSYSRHQYAELVFDQKIGTWLACHRHAFEWFGGVPRRIVPDYVARHIIGLLCPTGLCGRGRNPELASSACG